MMTSSVAVAVSAGSHKRQTPPHAIGPFGPKRRAARRYPERPVSWLVFVMPRGDVGAAGAEAFTQNGIYPLEPVAHRCGLRRRGGVLRSGNLDSGTFRQVDRLRRSKDPILENGVDRFH